MGEKATKSPELANNQDSNSNENVTNDEESEAQDRNLEYEK